MTGTIIHLDRAKGFGFIRVGGGRDLYFRRESMRDGLIDFNELEMGQRVECQVEHDRDGRPRAYRVAFVDEQVSESERIV